MANTKVTGDLIASSTIVEGNIANSAVTSDKIANSAITSGKISGITTAHITEGSNLYYTDARADARITAADTGDLSEGSNLYYTNARTDARVNLQTGANLSLSNKSTSDLSEGTNLYYTNTRADARVTVALIDEDNMSSNSATRLPSQQSVKAYVDAQILTKDNTDEIAEGSSNLYYTDARADARVTLIIDSAPSTLNTLNELAAALGDDANFSTTVTNSIATKLPLGGGTMTGDITFNNLVRSIKWVHTSGQSGSRAYAWQGEQGVVGRFALRSSNAADDTIDTDVLYFDNDLSATFAGNVGIGAAPVNNSGWAGLTLSGSTGGQIDFQDDGTTVGAIYNGTWGLGVSAYASKELRLYSGNSISLTLDASQNATFAGTVTTSDVYVDDYIYHNGDTNTYIRAQADQWTFRTGGDDRMHIDNTGVGIFTTSPQRTLDVRGTGLNIFGTGDNTEIMLRGQVEGTGTVRNVGSWHWSIRGDVGGDNDDLKLLRFVTGSYTAIALQFDNTNSNAAFAGVVNTTGSVIIDGSNGSNGLKLLRPTDSAEMTAITAPDSSTLKIGGGNQTYVKIFAHTTEVLSMNNSGNSTFSGNVGIANNKYITFGSYCKIGEDIDNLDALTIEGHSTESMYFTNSDNSVERLVLTGAGAATFAGDVEIGGAPSITPNTNFDNLVITDAAHSGITILSGTSSDGAIYFGDSAFNGGGQIKYLHASNSMTFTTDNNNVTLSLDNYYDATFSRNVTVTGNLIGKSDHTTELGDYSAGGIKRIKGSSGMEVVFGDSTTANPIGLTEGTWDSFGDSDYMSIYARNSFRMYGYGTSASPALHVYMGRHTSSGGSFLHLGGGTSPNGSFGASNTVLTVKGTTSGGEGIIQITGLGNNATDNVGVLAFHSQGEADPMCSIRSVRGSGDDVGSLHFLTNNGGTESIKMKISPEGNIAITAGYTDQNGVRTYRSGGVMYNNQAYNVDITVDDDSGTGTVHHIDAMMTHYSTSYGCILNCYAYTRATGVNVQTNLVEQSNAAAGAWTVSKPNTTTLRITKSAGTYPGSGNYQVVVITSIP